MSNTILFRSKRISGRWGLRWDAESRSHFCWPRRPLHRFRSCFLKTSREHRITSFPLVFFVQPEIYPRNINDMLAVNFLLFLEYERNARFFKVPSTLCRSFISSKTGLALWSISENPPSLHCRFHYWSKKINPADSGRWSKITFSLSVFHGSLHDINWIRLWQYEYWAAERGKKK